MLRNAMMLKSPLKLLFIFFLLNGCSSVTTYGINPEKTGAGSYSFTLYYNSDATDESIDKKAAEVVEKIRMQNMHSECTYARGEMVDPWRVKEIKVKVTCS